MVNFDAHAENYSESLAQGLAVSGEDSSYYIRGRIAWVKRCLDRIGVRPTSCLDYGCGCGDSAAELLRTLGLEAVTGVDVSIEEIKVAQRKHAGLSASFWELNKFCPRGEFDLAYCNGVFHHIAPTDRRRSLQYVNKSLRAGGYFAFWENNPWNPGTRYIMSRIPFDENAITLSPPDAARLLRTAGFTIVHSTFQFVFPRVLKAFRPLEPVLAGLPVGAQYQILCIKE